MLSDNHKFGDAVTILDGPAKAILEFEDRGKEIVTVEEWGGVEIELRSISVTQRQALLQKLKIHSMDDFAQNTDALITVFIWGAYDPNSGKPLFPDSQHVRMQLTSKSPKVLDTLVTKILLLSGVLKMAKNQGGATPGNA